ncbi:hypothetical protein CAL28_14250 [Bordetella genomosp. 11]|uniref:DUF1254 domain-containing protein n=2 Tax=Bordetella genomosp. 11 TaxID=1416808 RepID=A0A261UNZ1_9BORD|nr:hypothetical protein CAL28_14250 [Bordetella genomosp. 11]
MRLHSVVRGRHARPAWAWALLLMALAWTALSTAARAEKLSEEEARAIALDAYVYFYPIVTMDVTRRQSTNVASAGEKPGFAPPNVISNWPEFPPADLKLVVRPNFDTLYSSAFLDLTREPVVVSVPDTGGRYYLLPMLDMWTDVFASPGWRTTGTQAGHFLVAQANWRPDLRDRFDEYKLPPGTSRIDAPTPYVLVIGRTKTDGPADYDAVHKIQAGYRITPLSQWGGNGGTIVGKVDPAIDMKTPPKVQVDAMPGEKFFAYAAELLKLHPPHLTDQPIVARMKRLGIDAGKSLDLDALDPVARKAMAGAPEPAHQLMQWKLSNLAPVSNGWLMNTTTMGVYGDYYLKRAIIAQQGLGANLVEDAIYPLNIADGEGHPLDGANKYVIRFAPAELPPAYAFWSITLYDADGFQVPNGLNRFAVSSWMPFKYGADGSLELYFQNESPGKDREANWLPAPKGAFNLTMRLYAPKAEALNGRWVPPVVSKSSGPLPVTAQ